MQKISSGFGIAVVLVIAIFFGGLLFLVSKSFSVGDTSFSGGDGVKRLHANKGSRKKAPAESGSGESVSDWKMYENEKFRFRLRCPEGYVPETVGDNTYSVLRNSGDTKGSSGSGFQVFVTEAGTFKKNQAINPKEYTDAVKKKKESFSETMLDGRVAYQKESAENKTVVVFLEKTNGLFDRYDFTVSGELGERILKTFIFPKTEVVAE